jgi:hypothetical protein
MRPITRRQKQWLWFAGLWLAGLVSAAVLAYAARWLIRL